MTEFLLYIDPGSGSYLIQAIVAAVVGAAFWIKMSWHRIKGFFSGNKSKQVDESKEADKV